MFSDAVFSTAETALGFHKCKHQDWFGQKNQGIIKLIEAKRSAHAACLSDKNSMSKHTLFKQLRSRVQSRKRELKDDRCADKTTELQSHADSMRSKEFYVGLKFLREGRRC